MDTIIRNTIANPSCWKRLSALERRLMLIAIVGGLLCSAFAAGLVAILSMSKSTDNAPHEKYRSALPEDMCITPACIHAACKITNNMDESIKPCDNFYKFACGKFIQETIIPDDESSVTAFSVVEEQVQKQLKRNIEEPHMPHDDGSVRLVKNLYNSCMNTSVIEMRGVRSLLKILEKLGGWPVLEGDKWNRSNFHWIKSVSKFRNMGLTSDRLMKIKIGADLKNSIKQVIYLEQPSFLIPRQYIARGLDVDIMKAYHEYMIDIAVLLGAEENVAIEELTKSLEFEIALANASQSNDERRTGNVRYNPMTIKELSNEYPSIPWMKYINTYLAPKVIVDDKEIVVVNIHNYILNFAKLIRITPRRTQANYVLWRTISELLNYLNEDFRRTRFEFNKKVGGKTVTESRWKECIRVVSRGLPLSVSSLYIKKYFNKDAKISAIEIVEDIKSGLNDILRKADWMDGRTRVRAFDKAASITTHIGYPNEPLDNEELIEYYEGLQLNDGSYLKNILNLARFDTENSICKLRKPVKRSDRKNHAQFSYSSIEKSSQFRAEIFQVPFFDYNQPQYLNYGAIGSMIGHKIIHGFDNRGRLFDKDGNLMDWWTPSTDRKYLRKTNCIINQYHKYVLPEVELHLDGRNTHIENIADHGGVKLAYLAYKKWVSRNAREKRLPGLNYTPQQLFWISAANIWCAKHRPETLKLMITKRSHSPEEFRVLGPFSSNVDFARDFECSVGTRMNPKNKCDVW